MKALILNKATLKCDESNCDWTMEVNDLASMKPWHNTPCPKCNAGVIVNDAEMDMVNIMLAVSEVDIVSEGNQKLTSVHLDSLDLR